MSVKEITNYKMDRPFNCMNIQNRPKTLAIFKQNLKAKEVKIT